LIWVVFQKLENKKILVERLLIKFSKLNSDEPPSLQRCLQASFLLHCKRVGKNLRNTQNAACSVVCSGSSTLHRAISRGNMTIASFHSVNST